MARLASGVIGSQLRCDLQVGPSACSPLAEKDLRADRSQVIYPECLLVHLQQVSQLELREI